MEFDDTNSSGIWWSTNLAIRDACNELKHETDCPDMEIVALLRGIADSIQKNSL